MSDHLDGPRSIGDPSIDMTDLFCFQSPSDPGRTVFAADVFPSAGANAIFSDAAIHSIARQRGRHAVSCRVGGRVRRNTTFLKRGIRESVARGAGVS